MFEIGSVAFWSIVLFMVHEFEEIICVRPYIQRHAKDKRFASEIFVAGSNTAYPSTESIALMISQEFVLASSILAVGIAIGSIEVVLAPFIAFTLHLIPHAVEAVRFPGWAPGSRTAILLLAPSIALIAAVVVIQPVQPLWLLLCTVAIGAILVINLRGLHRLAQWLETKRTQN